MTRTDTTTLALRLAALYFGYEAIQQFSSFVSMVGTSAGSSDARLRFGWDVEAFARSAGMTSSLSLLVGAALIAAVVGKKTEVDIGVVKASFSDRRAAAFRTYGEPLAEEMVEDLLDD